MEKSKPSRILNSIYVGVCVCAQLHIEEYHIEWTIKSSARSKWKITLISIFEAHTLCQQHTARNMILEHTKNAIIVAIRMILPTTTNWIKPPKKTTHKILLLRRKRYKKCYSLYIKFHFCCWFGWIQAYSKMFVEYFFRLCIYPTTSTELLEPKLVSISSFNQNVL